MHEIRQILQGREWFSVDKRQTVRAAAQRMSELGVGAILVVADGRLEGIFTERDLMKRVVAAGLSPDATTVGDVMTTDLVTIQETATLEEAMQLMQQHKCRHLPVERGNETAGMVSMRDLMNIELERKTDEIQHMRAYIHGNP